MNTKTVKEKVKEIIRQQIESQMDWDAYYEGSVDDEALDKIDKLYRKEITKEVVNMPIDLGRFGYGDSLVTVVTKTIRQIEEGLNK